MDTEKALRTLAANARSQTLLAESLATELALTECCLPLSNNVSNTGGLSYKNAGSFNTTNDGNNNTNVNTNTNTNTNTTNSATSANSHISGKNNVNGAGYDITSIRKARKNASDAIGKMAQLVQDNERLSVLLAAERETNVILRRALESKKMAS